MLARELPALKIERVAIAVVRRHAEYADLTVLLEPAQLAVIGDIAPDKIAPDAVPCGTLGPERTRVEPLDGGFDPSLGIERRARRAAIEEDVVLDLQAAHLVFEPVKLFVNRVDLPGIHGHPRGGDFAARCGVVLECKAGT